MPTRILLRVVAAELGCHLERARHALAASEPYAESRGGWWALAGRLPADIQDTPGNAHVAKETGKGRRCSICHGGHRARACPERHAAERIRATLGQTPSKPSSLFRDSKPTPAGSTGNDSQPSPSGTTRT